MRPYKKSSPPTLAIIFAVCIVMAVIGYFRFSGDESNVPQKIESSAEADGSNKADASSSEAIVKLSQSQLNAVKIEPVRTYHFSVVRSAVGNVAYREQDSTSDAMPGAANNKAATKFIVANVPESDSPLVHVGQAVQAKVAVYPDHVFEGKVSALGITVYDSGGNPAIDPSTHRIAVRCEIADPKNELYPGMLATLSIEVQAPVESVGAPQNSIVRKGDGTMTAWVTKDRKYFEERTVKVGLQQDGYDQILEGLQSGELVVTDGAVFISNILYAPPSD